MGSMQQDQQWLAIELQQWIVTFSVFLLLVDITPLAIGTMCRAGRFSLK